MLSSRTSGKILSGRYAHERELCAQNKDLYSAADQAYLGISGQSVGMGDRQRIEDQFKPLNSPVDPETGKKEIDIRKGNPVIS